MFDKIGDADLDILGNIPACASLLTLLLWPYPDSVITTSYQAALMLMIELNEGASVNEEIPGQSTVI